VQLGEAVRELLDLCLQHRRQRGNLQRHGGGAAERELIAQLASFQDRLVEYRNQHGPRKA
jgi:hypothetical protein